MLLCDALLSNSKNNTPYGVLKKTFNMLMTFPLYFDKGWRIFLQTLR